MLSPPFSTVVYKIDDVKEVFFLLFLLVVLGEFFSAPAITLADSATLSYLGKNGDKAPLRNWHHSIDCWAILSLFRRGHGQVRSTANVRLLWLGYHHVPSGHCSGQLYQIQRPPLWATYWGTQLRDLLHHLCVSHVMHLADCHQVYV